VNKKSRTRLLIATGVIVVVFVIGVVFLVQKQGAYYRQVSDLTSGQYDGKNVKVGGKVMDGTINRDASGVHFTIQDLTGKPDTVKVTYSGQMPNTFNSGVDVVVVGKYASNGGVISADQLQTKCPSKYKGQTSTAPTPASAQ
jgi:cytochrome c-type biogenesis protein CcmE